MLAIAHKLITNQWHNIDFIKIHTRGFDLFNQYLQGSEDGVIKNSLWAEKICGVSQQEIAQLAYQLSHQRSFIISGWSMQRQQYGEQKLWMLVTLAALSGQTFHFTSSYYLTRFLVR